MPLYIKQNNTWTKLNKFHNVNGTWKPVYSYSWNVSEWSSCSKPCGTGIQTRTATCVRNDGIVKEDKFCTLSGVNKPVLQQYCNTHSCDPCANISTDLKYTRPFNDDVNQGKNGTTTWTFSVGQSGRYRVKLCLYVQAPTSGKSGISKCANFIGICVNAIRYCAGDCTYNSGDGMVELPVNGIKILTSADITTILDSPKIAYISFDLGLHQLNTGQNFYSVTTNTHTDTSTAIYGIFNTSTNGISVNLE